MEGPGCPPPPPDFRCDLCLSFPDFRVRGPAGRCQFLSTTSSAHLCSQHLFFFFLNLFDCAGVFVVALSIFRLPCSCWIFSCSRWI